MTSAEKITVLLRRRQLKQADLAKLIGTSPQNFSNKMKRDNFSEKELRQIAEALDCTLQIDFVMNDSKEVI